MSPFLTTYYAQRLEEEQEQLDAVNEALDALDMDRFQRAAKRVNNRSVACLAQKVASFGEIEELLGLMESLAGFLLSRVEYLKPLAMEERRRELEAQNREYVACV